jgi:hypothetical protein
MEGPFAEGEESPARVLGETAYAHCVPTDIALTATVHASRSVHGRCELREKTEALDVGGPKVPGSPRFADGRRGPRQWIAADKVI